MVDLLARLQLQARRCGVEVRLRLASRELTELIDLCGLLEVLGQPVQREELLRIEEEGQLGDPPA